MKATYDSEADVLYIRLNSTAIDESDNSHPGVILDLDSEGMVIGIEVMNASQRVEQPHINEYAVAA